LSLPQSSDPARDSVVADPIEPRMGDLDVSRDEYLTLEQLRNYAKLSERTLRNYLSLPPAAALPCYRPGRKVLVKRTEFDAWFAQYRQRGRPVLARVLRELGLDPERLPETRRTEKVSAQ
jgi:hypothetical protein